jgi:hypothetical protein
MILLAFLFALTGLAFLGLTSAKHHGWALGRNPSARDRARLRIGAGVTLAASLAVSMVGWGVAQGSVGWWGLLTLAAAMLLILSTYVHRRPRR